jgi:hypothetical protein
VSDWTEPDPLPWLLEIDELNPGIRYFALRDLLGQADDDPEMGHTANDADVKANERASE